MPGPTTLPGGDYGCSLHKSYFRKLLTRRHCSPPIFPQIRFRFQRIARNHLAAMTNERPLITLPTFLCPARSAVNHKKKEKKNESKKQNLMKFRGKVYGSKRKGVNAPP